MTKQHMKRPDKSRQNWRETRAKRWEQSKLKNPDVDHVQAEWAEEVTMGAYGQKYRRAVPVYGKLSPANNDKD